MNKKYYGIVEGFFSEPLKPWTLSGRLNTMKYIQQYAPNIGTYFYCPKDDLFVTKKWDRPYPKDDQAKLKKFIDRCSAQSITFFYGLNPALEEGCDWQVIELKVMGKLDQVLSLGCRNICLLFDDIPMAYDVVDGAIPESQAYRELVAMINRLYNYYKTQVDDYWVCMPDYTFKEKTALTQACTSLYKNIGVIWSGNDVFTKTITQQDITRVKKILFPDIRLVYWSNYPVNDCEQALGTFNLGGFYPIKQNVVNMLAGIVVNPMREAYANLPFYTTFSDFVQLGRQYRRQKSWSGALREIGVSKHMRNIIQQFSSTSIVDTRRSQKFVPDMIVNQSNDKVRNIWRNRFVNAVQQVFDDAKRYQIIVAALRDGKGVTQEAFLKWDWFPTKTYISRYYPEIVGIAKRRYDLYKKYYENENVFVEFIEDVDRFDKMYLGNKKLSISPRDNDRIQLNIENIMSIERELFLKVLDRKDISVEKKAILLYRRKFVNRFS